MSSLVAKAIYGGVGRAGRALPGGLRVVLYHHVADERNDLVDGLEIGTPPRLFEKHMRQLARDYEVVDLDQVLSGRLPRRPLLITFDDGYRSILERALPILTRLGLPSVFFVSDVFLGDSLPLDNLLCLLAARVGPGEVGETLNGATTKRAETLGDLLATVAALPYARVRSLPGELAERFELDPAAMRRESGLYLEGRELAQLRDHGCEVGNHTRSHVFCRCIADDEIAEEELAEGRRRLEQFSDEPVRAFSYPYGYREDATPLVERALRESGHAATFLVESRTNARRHDVTPWNRVSLHERPPERVPLELELLPRLRRLRDRLPGSG
jgi:peptidoglycan/xylan/chitin deacetylase (PgdA/CDA1 family)